MTGAAGPEFGGQRRCQRKRKGEGTGKRERGAAGEEGQYLGHAPTNLSWPGLFRSVRPRDLVFARFASYGGFESAEARSAKVESGKRGPKVRFPLARE